MTVRFPQRAQRARRLLLALGAALALSGAPGLAAAAEASGSDLGAASSEPRACPAEPKGAIDLEPDLARIREQIAHQAPPGPGEGEMLNSRGYNYGGGAMVVPASPAAEAELPR
jgi:hypothetical protein